MCNQHVEENLNLTATFFICFSNKYDFELESVWMTFCELTFYLHFFPETEKRNCYQNNNQYRTITQTVYEHFYSIYLSIIFPWATKNALSQEADKYLQ